MSDLFSILYFLKVSFKILFFLRNLKATKVEFVLFRKEAEIMMDE